MSDSKNNVISLALPVSLICLAAAIAYFSYALIRTVTELPPLLDKLENSSSELLPLIDQTVKITELIPEILDETAAIRGQIPGILEEVEAVRKTVPPVLTEWHATRTKTIPDVVREVEAVRNQLPAIVEESRQYRQQTIPDVLQESQQIRAAIPPTLTRTEGIVDKAQTIASSAGEDVVSGFFSGIVKAPVKLISGTMKQVLPKRYNLDDNEKHLLEKTMGELLEKGDVGDTKNFISEDTDFFGRITLLSHDDSPEKTCSKFRINMQKNQKKLPDYSGEVCKQPDGLWSIEK